MAISASGQDGREGFSCVRVRKTPADPVFSSRFEHVGAVHLTHADQGLELDAQRIRQILPTAATIGANAFQFQLARAEAVTGHGAQGPAAQRRSPRLLHPFELAARLWK